MPDNSRPSQKPKSEIIQNLPVSKTDNFSMKKITTLKYFEKIWSKKTVEVVLGEYMHMLLVAKGYRNFSKKSLTTDSPKKYKHAYKSYLEFAIDRGKILRKILKL